MSKLISLSEEGHAYDWFAGSFLFGWVVEFLRARVDDEEVRERMRWDALSGYLFVAALPEPARGQVFQALREELVAAVDADLYAPPLDVSSNEHVFAARVKRLASMAEAVAG